MSDRQTLNPDRFLPVSLLHIRKEQYHFSGNPMITRDYSAPHILIYGRDLPIFSEACARAGYHDQVFFDAAYQRIFSSSPAHHAGENMTANLNTI